MQVFKRFMLICCLGLSCCLASSAQGLSRERAVKIAESTVKISIEGETSFGTGFFISADGYVLTTWHTMEAAVTRDLVSGAITGFKKISVQTSSNEVLEAGIYLNLLTKDYAGALAYDYCLLAVKPIKHAPYPFYKMGDFSKLVVGDEVYTSGFPVGSKQSFISKGIVAGKSVDSTISVTTNGKEVKMPRSEALLNLTQNRSGGAIIKQGATLNDDEIIGIANFLIIPNGKYLEYVAPSLIGGCLSIQHFLEGLVRMK